jgi:predicted benzoate:H+ symporter BenE
LVLVPVLLLRRVTVALLLLLVGETLRRLDSTLLLCLRLFTCWICGWALEVRRTVPVLLLLPVVAARLTVPVPAKRRPYCTLLLG